VEPRFNQEQSIVSTSELSTLPLQLEVSFDGSTNKSVAGLTNSHALRHLKNLNGRMLKFVRSRQKPKDRHKDEDESATENSSNDSSDVESDSGSILHSEAEEDDELQGVDGSALAASNILAQPLVPDEENEDATLCLICPGKLLKNSKMVEVHTKASVSAHYFVSSRNSH
jgi:hypothetical protein